MSALSDALHELVRESADRAVAVATVCIENKARDLAPIDTGATRNQISADRSGDIVTVTSETEQGDIQNYGSGPYTIKPKGKKALFWPGADHPVASVNHPGVTRHRGWWDDAPWAAMWEDCLAEVWN